MTLTPFPVDGFAGLNLVGDPQEIGVQGSIDLLNVDFDKRGRVRSRDGYDNFTASAATFRFDNIAAFYKTDGTKQLLASSADGEFWRAYDTAGATIATQNAAAGVHGYEADFTRFGGPSAEVAYLTYLDPAGGAAPSFKWNGTAWAGANVGTAGVYPYLLEVKASDNRLVGAHTTSKYSRVGFSNAGVPETWGANDYVDLTPGDGERITALVSWRELVFVFKETKFFVFTDTSTSGTGTPIFNYRPVSAGVGAIGRACAIATPNGVYFLSRRGIYKTTGGDPVLVSRDIDPVFRGGASSFFLGGVLNHAAITKCKLAWHDERLCFAYPSGSATTNDRVLIFDPERDTWILWDVPMAGMASFRPGDAAELMFSYATGANHIGRLSPSYTTDDGTAIVSRIQSGFYDLGDPGSTAYTRWTRMWGTGSPTVSVFTDFASTDSSAAAVTLGTSPVIAEGYHLKSYQGQKFSHKLSASSAFSVSSLQHDIVHVR